MVATLSSRFKTKSSLVMLHSMARQEITEQAIEHPLELICLKRFQVFSEEVAWLSQLNLNRGELKALAHSAGVNDWRGRLVNASSLLACRVTIHLGRTGRDTDGKNLSRLPRISV